MKRLIWIITAAASITALVATAAPVPTLGTVPLSSYESYCTDLGCNTLAIDYVFNVAVHAIVSCQMYLFDKKGDQVLYFDFTPAVGMSNIVVRYFDKSWAVLQVSGISNMYFSIKVGSKPVILGTATTNQMRFHSASKAGVISLQSSMEAQLFDKNLVAVGAPQTLIGMPRGPTDNAMNDGSFFHCGDGVSTEVWKVKNGLERIINEVGDWYSLNEKKRLCCIEDGTTRKFFNYK